MAFFPVFLSVVFVVRNQSTHIERILSEASAGFSPIVSDYEYANVSLDGKALLIAEASV